MDRSTKEQRIIPVLQEYAAREVPDDLDGWPAVEDRLLNTMQSVTRFSAVEVKSWRATAGNARVSRSTRKISLATALIAVLGVTVFALAIVLNNSSMLGRGDYMSKFLPDGKVRHVVMRSTWSVTSYFPSDSQAGQRAIARNKNAPPPRTQDMWFTRGPNHLHIYIVEPPQGGEVFSSTTWIEDDATYSYSRGVGGLSNTVRKSQYNPRYTELYGPNPDIITAKLKLPGGRTIGNSTLDGRPVIVLESATMGFPDEPTPEPATLSKDYIIPTPETPSYNQMHNVLKHKWWVDSETYQLLQWQGTTTYVSGGRSGETETATLKTTVNELRDVSEFPPDFFKFKLPEGAKLEEWEDPTLPTATPSKP